MAKLSDLIQSINDGGFLVASVYQTAPDNWVACLRPKGKFTTVHGRASTLRGALRDAWSRKCTESLFDSWDYKVEDGVLVKKYSRRRAPKNRERVRAK